MNMDSVQTLRNIKTELGKYNRIVNVYHYSLKSRKKAKGYEERTGWDAFI